MYLNRSNNDVYKDVFLQWKPVFKINKYSPVLSYEDTLALFMKRLK